MRKRLNKQISQEDMDADWLRSFPGCEHYSDKEAEEILTSLDTLAEILLLSAARKTPNQSKLDKDN